MNLKVYIYDKCSTCRKALKLLKQHKVAFTKIPIRETPPSKAEIKRMLTIQDGNLRNLFNTSGMDYRQLGIKDQLAIMADRTAIELLASNGNLIKRPFAISKSSGMVGFKEAEWKEKLNL
ncbi:MAG: Regulatory protein Spx [Verrucomicrobia subdivision 3 bacterium]|nr:Regulatory protein Spx [Limisphaerales bacterium]MCS1415530.1 Regulatory protein Spx [Limisphaerales bacterium]